MVTRLSRRSLLGSALSLGASAALPASVAAMPGAGPRVIIDNDFGGDPDGLFLLAHFMMCRSVTIPLVIGTHYRDFGAADLVPDKGQASLVKARELLRYFPRADHPPLIAGTHRPLDAEGSPGASPASAAIVQEAMRSDAANPLYYAAGGSLTEIALAWHARPEIGKWLRLVWIGGNEHPDLARAPAGPGEAEYNFNLDRAAAQLIFNRSDIEIWQIPRNAFRQMTIGIAELDLLARENALGRYLRDQVVQTERRLAENLPRFIFTPGETYALGDTALVTLAALQSAFQPDTPTSSYTLRPTPTLNDDGSYSPNASGRPMRVYNSIDSNLTWRDFTAKLRMLNSRR